MDIIAKDLEKKMVLLTGPRQVGKTWIAKNILGNFRRTIYLNWDEAGDRTRIREKRWANGTELVVFDELHKMPKWKNYLKGLYDTKPDGLRILVTGSAKLNAFRKAGDSLAGRFFLHHILPFSLAELSAIEKQTKETLHKHFTTLLSRGGFPEPFLGDDADAVRWRARYAESLIRIDTLDFASIEDARAMQNIFTLLRENVGSPLSYSSLARDLGIAPNTAKRYVNILEELHIIFIIRPYTKKIARAILKEPKAYFFDTGMVTSSEGARFENLVAVEVKKELLRRSDETGIEWSLNYIRTKEGKESDFVLVREHTPITFIEAKLSDRQPAKQLIYFVQKYNVPGVQIVANTQHDALQYENVQVVSATSFLSEIQAYENI